MSKIRVTVWNEYVHEVTSEEIAKIYPKGIHGAIAEFLEQGGMSTTTATLDMPEHGLTQEVLANTDVLIWWSHIAQDKVDDAIVKRVHERVLDGMGLILLHSAHASKIAKTLLGTRSDRLRWREVGEREILWATAPGHPIMEGLPEKIMIPQEEMYGEYFHIAPPDELVFISWFEGGEVFRSGCCYQREKGRIFYFRPGHEKYPTYYLPEVQQVIIGAVRWAKPTSDMPILTHGPVEPIIAFEQKK